MSKFKFAKLPEAKPVSITKDQVDPNEYAIGMKEEQEHSSDMEVVETLVLQHLEKNPKYYSEIQKYNLCEDLKPIPEKLLRAFLGRLRYVGKTMEQINAKGFFLCEDQSEEMFKFAVQESKIYNIYFKYEGPPPIPTSREFCIEMLANKDKFYFYEDIQNLQNPKFGNYNIFQYKGSFNCRHHWQKYVFGKTTGNRINKNLVGKEPEEDSAVKVNDKVVPKKS